MGYITEIMLLSKKREIEGIGDAVDLILSSERLDPIRYFFKWLPNITSEYTGIMADNSLYMPTIFKLFIYLPYQLDLAWVLSNGRIGKKLISIF